MQVCQLGRQAEIWLWRQFGPGRGQCPCFVYWKILENIAPAARVIRRIISVCYALLGKTILEVWFLENDDVHIMAQVRIDREIWPQPSGVPSGSALGNSLGLRLYFTVHPSSCHSKDIIYHSEQWNIEIYLFQYCPLGQVYIQVHRTFSIHLMEYTVKYSP